MKGSYQAPPERELAEIPPAAGPPPNAAAIQDQVARILADPLFSSSKRFTSLLRFIVDRTIQGSDDPLKERIIGVEIFGRAPDYDTSLDASVRVAVTELRKRLHTYYQNPEHAHELRINLPTRTYLAEFSQTEQLQPEEKPRAPRRGLHLKAVAAAAAVVLLLALWFARSFFFPVPAIESFWAPILKSPGRVMLAVGVLPEDEPARPPDSLPVQSLNEIVAQLPRFPISDVNAVTSISSYLGLHGKESGLRVAQTVMESELRTAPLVLIGGARNDWAMRLGVDLRYRLLHDPEGRVHWIEDNTRPGNRSWSVDMSSPIEVDHVTLDYALISRVLDPGTGQWWVGAAGLTGLSTQAATQVLLDAGTMAALGKQLPKGWERRNLQVILEVKILRGNASDYRPVAVYSW